MTDYPALAPDLAAEIDKLLAPDRRLHARATELLEARLAALDADRPYINGAISEVAAQSVRGFAFVAEDPQRVKVKLLLNGQQVAALDACLMRPDLRALNAPRNGCVGFEHRFKAALNPGDTLEVQGGPAAQMLGRHRVGA
jgi:hypothetical protein